MRQKALNVVDDKSAKVNVPDIETHGDPDRWVTVCKAWSHEQRWMRSTKAMDVEGGALVQVSTLVTANNGSVTVSEAVTFVPGVCVTKDVDTGIVSLERPKPEPAEDDPFTDIKDGDLPDGIEMPPSIAENKEDDGDIEDGDNPNHEDE